VASDEQPARTSLVTAMSNLVPGRSATIEGRVSDVDDATKRRKTFRPGQRLRIIEKARESGNRPMSMVDPAYHVIEQPRGWH
jgi:hypothetical protein